MEGGGAPVEVEGRVSSVEEQNEVRMDVRLKAMMEFAAEKASQTRFLIALGRGGALDS